MLTQQKFISLLPMRTMFPTMLDKTTRMSIDFTATLASENRSLLLTAHHSRIRRWNFLESADGDGAVICLMTVREVSHSRSSVATVACNNPAAVRTHDPVSL